MPRCSEARREFCHRCAFHPVLAGLRRFRPIASRGFGVGRDPPGEAGLRDLARGQAQNDLGFILLRGAETIPVEGQKRL